MEVRGCSQVHFISVIKGDEVIKMHNIARGKSVLKLKNIEQIYVSDGLECQELESLPRSLPKVNRSLATTNCVDKAKVQVKTEYAEEGNELDFGTITLKQLRKTCKSKKRKAPMSVIMAAVKQEVCEEDELELKETLFSWKKKVLKKAKLKRKKRTSTSGSASSEIDDSGCILMGTPSILALADISSEIYNPLQIKVEYVEPYYEQPQAISFILSEDHQNSTCEMSGSSECCSSDQALESNSFQLTSVDRQNCILNEISYEELTDHMGYDLIMPQSSSFEEVLMIEGSDSSRKEDMSDTLTCDESPDECDSVAFQVYNPHSVESDAVTGHEIPLLESPCTDEAIHSDDSRKSKDVNMHIETSCAASYPSTTFVVEDGRSSVDNYVAPLSYSPVVQSSNAIEEPAVLVAIDGNGDAMMPHPPERLLSARKIISPISQEKLRKAMNSGEEQDDVEIHSFKEKLLFERNETKSFSSRQDVKGAGIDSSSKRQRMRKGKYEGRFPHSRGSVNGTQAVQTSPNLSNICSVQMCSQKAVAFSKQQVHDIERIATKLMSGLRSMKSIVVDALQHESRTGTKSKYNTDEVRLAVEKAGKVEETAQRWLSIMSRDCNRFCKIMSLEEADAPSPEKTKEETPSSPETKTIPKERKIMFADEAGGNLCNIKVFKNLNTEMDLDTPAKRVCTRTAS